MPKSKYGPALFEVYGKTRPEEAEPVAATVPHTRRTPAAESVSAFRATLAALVRSIGGSGKEPGEREADGSPAIALDGGKIHFSLSSRGAGVVAFGLILLASICFLMGRWVGFQAGVADGRLQEQRSIQGAAEDEIAQARQSAPIDGLFDDLASSPVAQGQPEAPPAGAPPARSNTSLTAVTRTSGPTWVQGNTYVVVQIFRGDEATGDAEKARQFLADNGIDTAIVGRGREVRLIATQGFNFKDETQKVLAERFLNRLRAVGEAYYKAGGRYKLEGYYATLTASTW